MNKKRTWTALAALGGLCLFLPPVLRLLGCRVFPEQSDLLLVWAGAALLGASAGVLRRLGRMAGDPSYRRKLKAESDERYQAIRDRAKAVSGEALQWAVLAAAWLSIGLDAPLWVPLAATGVYVAKSILELYLMVRYEREM